MNQLFRYRVLKPVEVFDGTELNVGDIFELNRGVVPTPDIAVLMKAGYIERIYDKGTKRPSATAAAFGE